MNFNAENQDNNENLKLGQAPKVESGQKVVLKNKKIDLGIKIMFFTAVIAIVLLVSGASLYSYKESVSVFGDSAFKPIYNKTFKSIKGNMYDEDLTAVMIIAMVVLAVTLIVSFFRRKAFPNTLDYTILGISCVPAFICFVSMCVMCSLSDSDSSGVAGTLSAHARKSSEPTFAFFVVLICCLLFTYGLYLAIQHRKSNLEIVDKDEVEI